MIGFVAKGTIEHVHVDLTDRTGLVTDLTGSGPTFDVIDFNDAYKVTASSASASGLRITVLLDTTVGGVWVVGEYRLLVKFTVGSEVIRKGPYYFQITE
jgi:hypothetical protein